MGSAWQNPEMRPYATIPARHTTERATRYMPNEKNPMDQDPRPLVTVITPTYNRASLIVETIERPPQIATVGLCDAVAIALDIFKRSITNTIMLGAFARTTGLVSLDSLCAAIEGSDFRDAGLKQNLEALERGYKTTKVHAIQRATVAAV